MDRLGDSKEGVTPSEPSFHIRPAKADDAYGIFDIFQRTANVSLTTGELFTQGQIRDVVAHASSLSMCFFVAETDATPPPNHFAFLKRMAGYPQHHSLIGCIILSPFRPSIGTGHNCFSKTGNISTIAVAGSSFDEEYLEKVRQALVSHVLTTCREQDSSYKSILVELSLNEDEPRTQQNVYRYQEQGFKIVGKLEAVMERHGVMIDRVIMQKHL